MIAIRSMTSDDLTEALSLWQATEGVVLGESDSLDALTLFLNRNPGFSSIARDDHRLAGVALAGHDGRRGYLHHVAVPREYRKRGIGKKLVERCLKTLREQGILRCHLFLLDDNAEGERFWEHLGWRRRDSIRLMSIDLRASDDA